MRIVLAFLKAESGATSVEYALIGGIVSLAIVAGTTVIGTKINATFVKLANVLS